MEQQSVDNSTSIYNMVCWIFYATAETCFLKKKKDSLPIVLLIDIWSTKSSAGDVLCNEIHVVFIPDNATFILQPVDQKVILIICFLGPHPWHMEVLRPGAESEL